MAEKIVAEGMDTLNATVLEYGGIQLGPKEFAFIMNNVEMADNKLRELHTSIGSVLSHRALVGWTTPGHTGVDVNLYAYGKRPSTMHGVKENTAVGNDLWAELGLLETMAEITESLKDMTFPDILPPDTQPNKKKYVSHH